MARTLVRRGEAAKPPAQILADGAAALRRVHSFVMDGNVTIAQQPMRIELRVHDTHSMELALASYGASAELIAVSTGSYIRGNTGFWFNVMGRRGRFLADRWIEVPPATAAAIVGSVQNLSTAAMSRCFAAHHGTLSVSGTASVDGHPAVLITDAGDAPGSTPEKIAIAATGPPYPLQLTTTGARRPGGRADACSSASDSHVRGSVAFAGFGAVGPIAAPSRATRFGHEGNT